MGIAQGRIIQSPDEEITYGWDVTNVSSSDGTVTSPSMKVYEIDEDVPNETDVSATVLEGDMSVDGQVITLEKIKSLTAGKTYRVEITFTKDGHVLTDDAYIECSLKKLR